MDDLFVDTSGWASWADKSQQYHSQATNIIANALESGVQLITTNFILFELAALLSNPLRVPKSRQIQLITDLRNLDAVELISIDPLLETDSWKLWQERPDKEYSLVDCASFVVMKKRGLLLALTTDHHFEQEGFVRLLK